MLGFISSGRKRLFLRYLTITVLVAFKFLWYDVPSTPKMRLLKTNEYNEGNNTNTTNTTIKIINENERPVMHTFFAPAYRRTDALEKDLLIWKQAWRGAYWNPVVLTLDDAKLHKDFEKFEEVFDSASFEIGKYDRMCFYRWLAMSAAGGGWMSDYDTYPLHIAPSEFSVGLPNNGSFTGHQSHVPSLVSGSKDEWDRMVGLILAVYQKHTDGFWSDMRSLSEVREAFIQEENVANPSMFTDMDVMNRSSCEETKGMLAIHFSHSQCTSTGFCRGTRVLNKLVNPLRRLCSTEPMYTAVKL